jgi:hypothetical protein
MRCLTDEQANLHLRKVGLELGDWGQAKFVAEDNGRDDEWVKYRAPDKALDLYSFSQHIAGWLHVGEWKIVQIDNSTNFSLEQATIFNQILSSRPERIDFIKTRSFLFDYSGDTLERYRADIRVAFFANLLLLFEGHGSIVSVGGGSPLILSLQDGFVYFISREETELARARSLLACYEQNRLMSPSWITSISSGSER